MFQTCYLFVLYALYAREVQLQVHTANIQKNSGHQRSGPQLWRYSGGEGGIEYCLDCFAWLDLAWLDLVLVRFAFLVWLCFALRSVALLSWLGFACLTGLAQLGFAGLALGLARQ